MQQNYLSIIFFWNGKYRIVIEIWRLEHKIFNLSHVLSLDGLGFVPPVCKDTQLKTLPQCEIMRPNKMTDSFISLIVWNQNKEQ